MQNPNPQAGLPKFVTIRPYMYPSKFLHAAVDRSRALETDFDLRVKGDMGNDSIFVLENKGGNLYDITLYADRKYYLFCSNDGVRRLRNDFDARAHAFAHEQRNQWIIEKVAWTTYTIRSATNPDHYLFYADDNSNAHRDQWDVRTHPVRSDNNLWIVDNYLVNVPEEQVPSTPSNPYAPAAYQNNPVTYRLRRNDQRQVHLQAASGRIHGTTNPQPGSADFWLENVHNQIYRIANKEGVIAVDPSRKNEWGDMEVYLTQVRDNYSEWSLDKMGPNQYVIRAVTQPSQLLFSVDEPAHDRAVRTHTFKDEPRNIWFIEGFNK